MLTSSELSKLILSFGPVTHKKLQKLSYYLCSWYMTIYDKRLADVNFEAWVHGPVSREIYSEYKKYGWNSIPQYDGYIGASIKDVEFAEKIIELYGDMDADELEERTHREDPWINARIGYDDYQPSNRLITSEDICNYYRTQNDYYEKIVN